MPDRWKACYNPLPHVKSQVYNSLMTDRKSTRLNSSHSQISYAVFCLKKKKTIVKFTLDTLIKPLHLPIRIFLSTVLSWHTSIASTMLHTYSNAGPRPDYSTLCQPGL